MLRGTLDDLLAAFGDRKISLCRELTKLNEEITRTTLSGAVRLYSEREPRGEYVLIVDGQSELEPPEGALWRDLTVEEHQQFIDEGKSTRWTAMKACAKGEEECPKSEVYRDGQQGKERKIEDLKNQRPRSYTEINFPKQRKGNAGQADNQA